MDLVAAIKNALDRGYTLEQAKQTLINSGYGTSEIDGAARYLTGGFGTTPETIAETFQPEQPGQEMPSEQEQIKQAVGPEKQKIPRMQQPSLQQQMPKTPMKKMPEQPRPQISQQPQQLREIEKPKKPFPWAVFLLLIILLILIGGLIMLIIFRNSIINFFQTL